MLFYQIIPENAGLCNEILAQLFYFADKVTIIWKYTCQIFTHLAEW